MQSPPSLIGGIGMTEVTVYAQRPAPDSLNSGCPHIHALTDEAYYVLRGTGEVEFFDSKHGLRTLELTQGMYVHFPPLVMHRIISREDLAILAVMGNAGLAEHGDARIYFGPEADRDAKIYEELHSLPRRLQLEGALQRRDHAVAAYLKLIDLWKADPSAAAKVYDAFVARHLETAEKLQDRFSQSVQEGPLTWGNRTLKRLEGLPSAAPDGPEIMYQPKAETPGFGMCGILRPVNLLSNLD